MSQPQRAREQAEAMAAVAAVMQREDDKVATQAAKDSRKAHHAPVQRILLFALIALNVYVWAGNPSWLRFREPQLPQPSYYASSWKLAVYLQRQRIEDYRRYRNRLPSTAAQAGPPVKGVVYRPLESKTYELAAGDGLRRFVYLSSDSLNIFVGRAFLQMSLLAGGAR